MGTTPANVQNVLRKAREEKVVRRNRDGGYALTATAKAGPNRRGSRKATFADSRGGVVHTLADGPSAGERVPARGVRAGRAGAQLRGL